MAPFKGRQVTHHALQHSLSRSRELCHPNAASHFRKRSMDNSWPHEEANPYAHIANAGCNPIAFHGRSSRLRPYGT